MLRHIILPAAALLATAAAPAPAADPVLAKLIEGARATPPLGYERSAENLSGGKRQVVVDRYSPTAQPQFALVSVDGKPPSTEEAERFGKLAKNSKPAGYYRIAELLAGGAERVQPNLYRVTKLPPDFLRGQMAAMSDHVIADIRVGGTPDRPYVTEYRLYAPKPARVRIVAKIDSFEAVTRYALGSDGRPRLREQTVMIRGDAMGSSLNTDSTTRYRDL
jgi:hypothetical protein